MTLEELCARVPELNNYLKFMPQELNERYWIHTYPEGTIIHQKDELLEYFGIVCEGSHRVINEFENGNVYMIEPERSYRLCRGSHHPGRKKNVLP